MNEEIDKIIVKQINESYEYINLLTKRIDFYKHRIDYLNQNKPFFFKKKKLKQYYLELKLCNEKIERAYTQIGIEEEMIIKMKNN